MFQRLKEYFVPHEGNDHRPHFLRSRYVARILLLLLVLEVGYLTQTLFVLPRSDYFAAIFASVLVDQTNLERGGQRLSSLLPNPQLEAAAKLKADDMAARGYFAHNTPDGRNPWWFVKEAGYAYDAAGENLAVNFTDSSDVTKAWMNSPLHRANIVNGNFTEIGIATARGMYKGKEVIFVVQMFGRPALPMISFSEVVEAVKEEIMTPPTAMPTIKVLAEKGTTTPLKKLPPVRVMTATTTPASSTPSRVSIVAGAAVDHNPEAVAGFSPPEPSVSLSAVSTASVWEQFVASPRKVAGAAYLLIALLVMIALCFAIFVKIRIQHPILIMNGLLLLSIIVGITLFNALLVSGTGMV
jgi:uncharacterized protein YkwD